MTDADLIELERLWDEGVWGSLAVAHRGGIAYETPEAGRFLELFPGIIAEVRRLRDEMTAIAERLEEEGRGTPAGLVLLARDGQATLRQR